MLFIDQMKAKDALLRPEFERLFNLAITKQAHPGDLLLLYENGSYNPDVTGFPGPKLSPFVIGPGNEGWSYMTHYKFINEYRSRAYKDTQTAYLAELNGLTNEQDFSRRYELELTIQLESLIYLKIWESDFVIKRFYEFVRLLSGEPFDWHFKVTPHSGSKKDPSTGARHEIIRLKVRDKVKPLSALLYQSLAAAYKSQIRNSIAHSNYSMQGRYIHPNNFDNNDLGAQIRALSFDEWIEMFHLTMALYNELIGLSNKILTHYEAIASKQNNHIEVMVPDASGTMRPKMLVYRPEFKDFRYWQAGDNN